MSSKAQKILLESEDRIVWVIEWGDSTGTETSLTPPYTKQDVNTVIKEMRINGYTVSEVRPATDSEVISIGISNNPWVRLPDDVPVEEPISDKIERFEYFLGKRVSLTNWIGRGFKYEGFSELTGTVIKVGTYNQNEVCLTVDPDQADSKGEKENIQVYPKNCQLLENKPSKAKAIFQNLALEKC